MANNSDPEHLHPITVPVGGGGRVAMLGLMSGRNEDGAGFMSLLPGDA